MLTAKNVLNIRLLIESGYTQAKAYNIVKGVEIGTQAITNILLMSSDKSIECIDFRTRIYRSK